MKIIGTAPNGFILEARRDEVANLIGYYSHYSSGVPEPVVGSTVNVANMFMHLHNLGNEKQEIRKMAAKLRAAADLIETLPEPITNAEANPDQF